MATTERAKDFMRSFRRVHFDTHCDHDRCHGTHLDRITWEIALRRTKELGTIEVMAELEPHEGRLIVWVAYVAYVRELYTGCPGLMPPPERTTPRVTIPREVAEAGLDHDALADICWLCDDPKCPICSALEGSRRIQRFVLQERGVVKRLAALNSESNMTDFFDLLDERMEDA